MFLYNFKSNLKLSNATTEFKYGQASCEGKHYNDCPNEVTSKEMIIKVGKIVSANHRLKVRGTLDFTSISTACVHIHI